MERRFPPLPLKSWKDTRDAIHNYSQVLGAIREAHTPVQKHWWHGNLRPGVTGLITPPIPTDDTCPAASFSLQLDLTSHHLIVTTSLGEAWHKPLQGQSLFRFCQETVEALASMGIEAKIDPEQFGDNAPHKYDEQAAERFWQVMACTAAVMAEFRAGLREETSPINIWPHHFDMAVVWFSGRLIPGADPAEAEDADEQIGFGFSTGDETYPDPYVYITAFPKPNGFEKITLPEYASWTEKGFEGVLLMYDDLLKTGKPRENLLKLFTTVQLESAKLMR